VWCAVALLSFAACSFPEYDVGGSVPLPTSCRDGVRNELETDTDCGGPVCAACPPCRNGMLDGEETGVDCGGDCAPCPSCDDELQNGSESDVDCGGTCAKRCETDQRCREGADCASLVCNMNCQPSSCNDLLRNGKETGRDCGGGCPGCPNGSACNVASDCESMRCQDQVCVSAGCTDQTENGLETDEDCGGRECGPCDAGRKCEQDSDCESKVCDATRTCAGPSCTDEVANQGESDEDCGGPNCGGCPVGDACTAPSDCATELCQNGTCVPQTPSGEPLDKQKWTLSTSESATEMGVDNPFDGDVNTAWTSGKQQYTGMYVEVDLGSPKIFFKVLLQVTQAPYAQDFPGQIQVYISNDGTFGDPAAVVQGNQWTWIDFPSAQVGRYVRFLLTKPVTEDWSIGEINFYN
jgi:hypothetical protein